MKKEEIKLKPLLKYPGGKSSELIWIIDNKPEEIENYIEPFVGGGAVYFAAFDKFSKNDTYDYNLRLRAEKITKYIKFGTDNDKEIWLLRYGFEFEDFDWLLNHVEFVNEKEIVFKNISELNEEQLKRISKFV